MLKGTPDVVAGPIGLVRNYWGVVFLLKLAGINFVCMVCSGVAQGLEYQGWSERDRSI